MRIVIVALAIVTTLAVVAQGAASQGTGRASGFPSIVVGTDADASGASITALVEKNAGGNRAAAVVRVGGKSGAEANQPAAKSQLTKINAENAKNPRRER